MSGPEAAMLKLPDELLLDIAKEVDVIGLKGLSLTCRRTRPIAQEALVRRSTLSLMNVWKLVETLRIHPGLATAFTHMRIRPTTEEEDIDIEWASEMHARKADHTTCCDTIPRLYARTDKAANDVDQARPDDFYSAGVAVLIALAKGLTAISMSKYSFETVPVLGTLLNNDISVSSCWHKQAQSQLADRLVELNVDLDTYGGINRSASAPYPLSFMQLTHLKRLKRLVVPAMKIQYVALGFIQLSDPCSVLPDSLENIQLTQIGPFFDVSWLSKLLRSITSFPSLRKVEMQFHFNMLSTGWDICASYGAGQRFLTLLRELKASKAPLTMAFGNVKFADAEKGMMLETSEDYIPGDLVPALEKCLATTHDDLEKDPEMLSALGYTARPTG